MTSKVSMKTTYFRSRPHRFPQSRHLYREGLHVVDLPKKRIVKRSARGDSPPLARSGNQKKKMLKIIDYAGRRQNIAVRRIYLLLGVFTLIPFGRSETLRSVNGASNRPLTAIRHGKPTGVRTHAPCAELISKCSSSPKPTSPISKLR